MDKDLNNILGELFEDIQECIFEVEKGSLIFEEISENILTVPEPNLKNYKNQFKQLQTKALIVSDYLEKVEQYSKDMFKKISKANVLIFKEGEQWQK